MIFKRINPTQFPYSGITRIITSTSTSTITIGVVFSSRRCRDQGPPSQLHDGSSEQKDFGDKYRVADLSHKCAIENFFSKVLIIKIPDDEVITISLFQRQDLLARRRELNTTPIVVLRIED